MPYLGNVPSSFNVGTNNIDNGSVTTEKIADGAVVNADVNASAAIAGTKISPNFGSQNLLTTGTATAASLIPTSSTAPANGLFLPSANNVAISTNGQGRLFVDANGNVGVGTSANKTISIASDDTSNSISGAAGLQIVNTNAAAAGRLTSVTFGGRSVSSFPFAGIAGILTQDLAQEQAGHLAFFTKSTTTAVNPTERLRITSTGTLNFVGAGTAGSTQAVSFNGSASANSLVIDSSGRLGVGTGSPTTRFHVDFEDAAANSIRLVGDGATNGAALATSWFTGSSYFDVRLGGNTTSETKLRIQSDGKVGIGTSSPGSLLTVKSPGAATTFFNCENSSGTSILRLFQTAGGSGRLIVSDSTGTDFFNVQADQGRVGIGSSSPDGTLHVQGTNSGGTLEALVLRNNATAAGTQTAIRFTNSTGAFNHASIVGTRSGTGALDFYTAGSATAAMSIDSSSRVGIGTTNPGTNLYVSAAGAGTKGGEIIISNSSARQNGNFAQLGFAPNNDYSGTVTCAFIRGLDTGGSAGNPAALTFGVGSGGSPSERMRIDDSGRLLVGTLTSRGTNAPTMVQSRSASGISPGYTVITGNEENAGGLILAATVSNSVAIIVDPDNLRANTDLKFEIDGAERLRFNSGGSAGFFNAADTIWGASSTGAGTAQAIYVGSNGASGVYGGSVCYKVFTNGNVQNTNNSYTALSDIKLKENIVDANSQWDDIKALKVRNYNLKEGQTHKQIGLIAQEVEPISPGLVYESPDRDEDGNDLGTVTKSVNYSVLYMKAVKALQEAMERIEQLETEMAAVKAQLS